MHFREYFSTLTDISPFKFADMAAWKSKKEHDLSFTIQRYAKSLLEIQTMPRIWSFGLSMNQFLKDFCADENNRNYSNKLKVASILWKEVRNSENEKIYSKESFN